MIILKRLCLAVLLVLGSGAALAQPGGGPSKAELKPLPVLPKMAAPSNLQGMVATINAEDVLVLDLSTGGRVRVIMRPDVAPKHVERIRTLARQGFYDGTVFHRVIEGFMAQTGDPTGTGMGGSGQKLKAEFSAEPHVRGICSMARAQDPNSGDSQFFICFDDARFLDKQYTVWGQVSEGMENVDKIKRGEPVRDPDKIVSARMADAAA
jgi:peptidylprolyl isomerase